MYHYHFIINFCGLCSGPKVKVIFVDIIKWSFTGQELYIIVAHCTLHRALLFLGLGGSRNRRQFYYCTLCISCFHKKADAPKSRDSNIKSEKYRKNWGFHNVTDLLWSQSKYKIDLFWWIVSFICKFLGYFLFLFLSLSFLIFWKNLDKLANF